MKIKDTELAEVFGVTPATVGNYRKSTDKRRNLYDAMVSYFKRIQDDVVDAEYFIEDAKDYWIYKTIRDTEPLFAYFPKSDLGVGTFSVELEDDIDKIKRLVQKRTSDFEVN